jgi:hypothetical protein
VEPEANTWGQRVKSHETGHGTKVAIARLEGQRQALTLMDHPNIAWLLDDRVIDTGWPCLVLERAETPRSLTAATKPISTKEPPRTFPAGVPC